VGIADTYLYLGLFFEFLPPRQVMPQAKAAAAKALQLDESLAGAHTSLGMAALYYDWDLPKAREEFSRAIQLDPNYVEAHHQYGWYFIATGHPDEATAELQRALALDPLSLIILTDLGVPPMARHQYDLTIEQERRALEIDPNYWFAHLQTAWPLMFKGDYKEALLEGQAARNLEANCWTDGFLAALYPHLGKRAEAMGMLQQLKKQSAEKHVPHYLLAQVYSSLGDTDQVFQSLEKGYQDRSGLLIQAMKWTPSWIPCAPIRASRICCAAWDSRSDWIGDLDCPSSPILRQGTSSRLRSDSFTAKSRRLSRLCPGHGLPFPYR